jgi:hypothetical protein
MAYTTSKQEAFILQHDIIDVIVRLEFSSDEKLNFVRRYLAMSGVSAPVEAAINELIDVIRVEAAIADILR